MEPDQVFPELVWERIFDKIEDDADKLSFLRAHSAFRKQFEQKHVELGFLFTLPVLMNYFEAVPTDWCWELNRERRQSTFSSRLVSRKCSKAVDNWMESYWEKETDPPLIFYEENEINYTELCTRTQVEKFREHFGTLSEDRMPILSRSLNIAIPLQNEQNEIPVGQELEDNERREILTAIGAHVKVLMVQITLSDNPGLDNVENARDLIETFKSVLEQVPNLKSLDTTWEPILYPGWEEEGEEIDLPELPQLINLSLTTSEMPEDEDEVFATDLAPFEKYFPQLTHLELFNLDGWKEEYMEAGVFPKLRHLKLFNVLEEKYNHRRTLLTMFRKCFAPDLETISVSIRGSTDKEEGWIRRLLDLLNKHFKKENSHWHGCQGEGNRLHFWRV